MANDARRQIVDLLPRLRRFACALTGDVERGDDLVQETCLRALARIDQWEEGTRLDSWLYRIAQNIWFDTIRATKVRGEQLEIDDAVGLVGEDGRKVVDGRLALSEVAQVFGRLPQEQRDVVALVCLDGFTYRQAAEALNVPMGTIMSRLARARQAIYAGTADDVSQKPASELEKPRGRPVR